MTGVVDGVPVDISFSLRDGCEISQWNAAESILGGMSLLASIGFTVSLLVAELSFSQGSAQGDHAKVGILDASLLAALANTVGPCTVQRLAREAGMDGYISPRRCPCLGVHQGPLRPGVSMVEQGAGRSVQL